ncbi:hypothetical protein [Methylobacterium aquaticum]|uniref:Uncharacterized protein n=1 Tax=Methylobacterium aquaticum TaxID=270351 RepID=A0A0J6VBC4_9HYPH|nr:hypothetical protein [Methylobacterium aquaticum]KMO36321.1 hypothetical protein VP06_10085 [Methylobacterium aquaticum]
MTETDPYPADPSRRLSSDELDGISGGLATPQQPLKASDVQGGPDPIREALANGTLHPPVTAHAASSLLESMTAHAATSGSEALAPPSKSTTTGLSPAKTASTAPKTF